jgi:putative flavoprotein involved in K+ transport
LNLHQFARDGVVLLGHIRGAHKGRLIIAPDMKKMLAKVDQFELDALGRVNDYIARTGLNASTEVTPQLRDGYEQEEVTTIDLETPGIAAVICATGYNFDFSLVELPVVDGDGYSIQKHGVSEFAGLYLLGMPWLHSRRSGILFGVGDDAAYLAAHIVLRNEKAVGVAA